MCSLAIGILLQYGISVSVWCAGAEDEHEEEDLEGVQMFDKML